MQNPLPLDLSTRGLSHQVNAPKDRKEAERALEELAEMKGVASKPLVIQESA
jgi:hypothetical protein